MILLSVLLAVGGFLAIFVVLIAGADSIWILFPIGVAVLGGILFALSPWPKTRRGLPFAVSFGNDCGVYTKKKTTAQVSGAILFEDGSTVVYKSDNLQCPDGVVSVFWYEINNKEPQDEILLFGKLGWEIIPGDWFSVHP